jgi:hypothetical protein
MKTTPPPATASPNVAAFVVYVAAVLTVAIATFPPFTSLYGTEYAFVLTGPEWSRSLQAAGADLGLTARIHWPALLVQLTVVWALAFGARWFLGGRGAAVTGFRPPPG